MKILFEKGLKICSNCKKENPLDHAFCAGCGSKFPEGSDKQVELPAAECTEEVAVEGETK